MFKYRIFPFRYMMTLSDMTLSMHYIYKFNNDYIYVCWYNCRNGEQYTYEGIIDKKLIPVTLQQQITDNPNEGRALGTSRKLQEFLYTIQ